MKKREVTYFLGHILFRAKFLVLGLLCSLPFMSASFFIAPGICILGWIIIAKTKKSWWAEEIRYFVIGFSVLFTAAYLIFAAYYLRLLG